MQRTNLSMYLMWRGMSQCTLASITGLSRLVINQYCNGHVVPGQTARKLIAQALEISEGDLLALLAQRDFSKFQELVLRTTGSSHGSANREDE